MNSPGEEPTLAPALEALVAEYEDAFLRTLTHDVNWEYWLALGAAERALAGDHADRYWLELAQNARDALRDGGDGCGRAWFGVTDAGIIVANDGAPFRLDDPKVMKAVCSLDRSTKAHRQGFVGHKGIGLKSVLLAGAGFGVRSRGDDGEVRRIAWLRSLTWARLERRLDALVGSGGIDRLTAEARRAERSRIPLFAAPGLLPADGGGADAELLEDLLEDGSPRRLAPEGLDETGAPSALPKFRTVVCLPFADEGWGPKEGQAGSRAEQAWRDLERLTPEVLITLGELREVHFVRLSGGSLREARRLDLVRGRAERIAEDGSASATLVHADLSRWAAGEPVTREPSVLVEFEQPFTAPGDDGEPESCPIRALVAVTSGGRPAPRVARPLALYYPIDHAPAGVPFVLHGPFRVTPNRKELAADPFNREVLDAALDLLASAAAWSARPGAPLREAMPWAFAPLPPVSGTIEAVGRFRDGLARQLRDLAIVPTRAGPAVVGSTLMFDPERPRGFEVLADRLPARVPADAVLAALDDPEVRDGLRWAARAVGLGDALSAPEHAAATATTLGEAWPPDGETFVLAPAGPSRAFCAAVAAWLSRLGDGSPSVARALGAAALPLLPAEGEKAGRVRLVRVGERTARDDTGVYLRRRVLLWRDRDDQADLAAVPPPPGDLPIFVADGRVTADDTVVAMLRKHGEGWGARRFERLRTLVERVAERMADSATKTTELLGYFAVLLDLLEAKDASVWRVSPYWTRSPRAAHAALADDRRAEFLAVRRLARVRVPDAAGGWRDGESLAISAAWADAVRGLGAGNPDALRWAVAMEQMDAARGGLARPAPIVAGPEDPVWSAAVRTIAQHTATPPLTALARALLAVGASPGPVLSFRWTRWDDRQHEDLPCGLASAASQRWTAGSPDGLRGDLEEAIALWRATAWSSEHHPSHRTWHSERCGWRPSPRGERPSNGPPVVAVTWTWSDELAGACDPEALRRVREALAALATELRPLLETSWVCRTFHSPGQAFGPVPSLLHAQLSLLPMWEAHGPEGLETVPLPASRLVASHEAPSDAAVTQMRWLSRLHVDAGHAHAELAQALGIVPVDKLPSTKAWRLLAGHIEACAAVHPVPPDASVIALRAPDARSQWTGVANLLVRQVLNGPPDASDEVRFRWRAHDLALSPGWLLAHRGEALSAVRVCASGQGKPASLRGEVENYRERPPAGAVLERVVLVTDAGDRPRFAGFARALGAPESAPPTPKPFPGERVDTPEAHAALERLRREGEGRLHLLLGVLAIHRSDPAPDARRLIRCLETLRAHAGAGRRPASGLTSSTGREVAVSLDAVEHARRVGAPLLGVLARGLAHAVEAPTYERDLRIALTDPVDEVRAWLADEQVDVDAIVRTVDELAALRAAHAQAVRAAFDAAVPVAVDPEERAALKGELCEGLDDAVARIRWLGRLCRAVTAAGFDAGEVLRGGAGSVLPLDGVLLDIVSSGEAAVDEATTRLAAAITVAAVLIAHAGDEGLGATGMDPATVRARFRAERLRLGELDWSLSSDALAAPFEGAEVFPPGPMAGWTAETWVEIARTSSEFVAGAVVQHPELPCLSGLAAPGGAAGIEQALSLGAAQVASQRATRAAAWLTATLDSTAPAAEEASEVRAAVVDPTSRSAGSRGGGGDAARGDAAELASLRWLWQRFVLLDSPQRRRLLAAVVARRRAPGVPWSTQEGARRADKALEQHGQRLAEARVEDVLAVIEPFRALFDVSTEPGPGFDVIDWEGDPADDEWPRLQRVEVKAVPSARELRFRLTTNEFHRARADGGSYVLRLVEVADAEKPHARLVREIRDPVATLALTAKLAECVRGGEATFTLLSQEGRG